MKQHEDVLVFEKIEGEKTMIMRRQPSPHLSKRRREQRARTLQNSVRIPYYSQAELDRYHEIETEVHKRIAQQQKRSAVDLFIQRFIKALLG